MEPVLNTPKKQKVIRYPGDINVNDITPRSSQKALLICKNKIKVQAKTIKLLRNDKNRLKKKINTMKELINEMKEKFELSGEAAETIEVCRCTIVQKGLDVQLYKRA